MTSDKVQYEGYTIEIWQDEDAQNPRKDFDNLGTMGHWHRRYVFGEVDFRRMFPNCGHPKPEAQDFIAGVEKKGGVALPLGLFDHGGLHMYVGDGPHPHDGGGWDSGHVGYIWVEAAKLREEYSVKRLTKKVKERALLALRSEVEVFDAYLRGEVYGYTILDEEGENQDSCGGFYVTNDKDREYMLSCAKSVIQGLVANKAIREKT